jgi:hypothetical protein
MSWPSHARSIKLMFDFAVEATQRVVASHRNRINPELHRGM